ncbi:hypothetical protein LEP1GSC170_3155 [Leptospira interrogans serovar Bataviae str. HAI135]|nr:hypothetical protein LEP1GSC170_3155 [Leptospira interrogans serovar Bataviae str. HAI135]
MKKIYLDKTVLSVCFRTCSKDHKTYVRKMRKNFLKVSVSTILKFVRKVVICSSSHILDRSVKFRFHFFRKMNALC